MMRQVFSNDFVLYGNREQDEAGINYYIFLNLPTASSYHAGGAILSLFI